MTHRLIVLFAAVSLALAAPMTYAHHKSGHVDAGAGNLGSSEFVDVIVCNPHTKVCEKVSVEVDPGNSGAHNKSPEPGAETPPL